MRLIDADALMRTLGITDTDCGKCDLHGAMGCSKSGDFVDACVAIEHAPTIEVRKNGKWIREVLGSTSGYGTTVMYQCTNCESMAMFQYDFCPNCGSYNGGGENEQAD